MTKTRKVAISKKIDFVDLASASMLAAIDTKDTSKVAREVEMAPWFSTNLSICSKPHKNLPTKAIGN